MARSNWVPVKKCAQFNVGSWSALPTPDQAPLCRVRRKESMLQPYSLQVASRNAPADAEKTERLSEASKPSARVMHIANKSNSKPLSKAAIRVNAPRISAKPSRISAQVDAQARTGIAADGMNQLSLAVYAVKCSKSPHATFRCPNAPQ